MGLCGGCLDGLVDSIEIYLESVWLEINIQYKTNTC